MLLSWAPTDPILPAVTSFVASVWALHTCILGLRALPPHWQEKESCTPSCHPYQVPSYLRASLSFSRRTSASLLKPSSSSSSSNTPRSPHNSAWHGTPGSNGDRRPPIPRGCSRLLARRRETLESACYSLGDVASPGRNEINGAVLVLGLRPRFPARERRGRAPARLRAAASARPAPGLHQSARPAALGPAHLASRSQSDARPAARAAVVMVPRSHFRPPSVPRRWRRCAAGRCWPRSERG